jgi:hypothetical protein
MAVNSMRSSKTKLGTLEDGGYQWRTYTIENMDNINRGFEEEFN